MMKNIEEAKKESGDILERVKLFEENVKDIFGLVGKGYRLILDGDEAAAEVEQKKASKKAAIIRAMYVQALEENAVYKALNQVLIDQVNEMNEAE